MPAASEHTSVCNVWIWFHPITCVHYLKHLTVSRYTSWRQFLCYLSGLKLRPLGILVTIWPIVPALGDDVCGAVSWMIGRGNHSEETYRSATLSTTNPPWSVPGSNMGQCSGKPATDLWHGPVNVLIVEGWSLVFSWFHFQTQVNVHIPCCGKALLNFPLWSTISGVNVCTIDIKIYIFFLLICLYAILNPLLLNLQLRKHCMWPWRLLVLLKMGWGNVWDKLGDHFPSMLIIDVSK
jgi:hypothetical protein